MKSYKEHTPFSYPWGANRYYFNSDAKLYSLSKSKKMTFDEIRKLSHTHKTDRIPAIYHVQNPHYLYAKRSK